MSYDVVEVTIEKVTGKLDDAPNIPGCTCDRESPGAPLCEMHERILRPLSWDSLAYAYVDLTAAVRAGDRVDADGLIRNIEERLERAQAGASVGELSGSPVGEAIAWELASLLVDVTESRGLSAAERAWREYGGEDAP